jgi:4-amino-4-deoxy-L-arabinose transferase-like glycosyltransferase
MSVQVSARPVASVPRVRPRWELPLLGAILLLSGLLYGWGLSGTANDYYSAAVRSGTESWKAFFFGSLDSASFITVDKPPMALWVQELTARVIGFGTWSLLLPSVVMGVAAIAVLYATVRRVFGPVAGLIAALVMALTPITVAIDRDNNPDTLLVLLLVLAAWAAQRAVASGRLSWLCASAFFLGCGFDTKMLQAYLLLPALVLVYLLFAPGGWGRRLWRLLVAGGVLAVASFWWMVVVDLVPAGSRPYVGGSTDGTVWDLVIGYNGVGRVAGEGGRGSGGPGFAGASGPWRLFNDIVGGQISWLLPFAVLALVACLVLRGGRLERAALVLWGGWLVVHVLVFSFAAGTMHPYYTTALAPAIAALSGIGAVTLRSWVLPAGVAVTGLWAFVLLRRTPSWNPWLAWVVAVLTVVAVAGLLAARFRSWRRVVTVAAMVGLVAGLAGPGAYAVSAAAGRTNGTNPLAGPSSGFGGPGRGGPPGGRRFGGAPPAGFRPPVGGGFPGGGPGRGGFPGGPGAEVSAQLISYLEQHRDGATWLLAVGSAQSASSIILRTGQPVIAMGGFTGSDPAMTVAKLQAYVRAGKVHYVMTGGGSSVTAWVTRNCAVVRPPGGATLYRCG